MIPICFVLLIGAITYLNLPPALSIMTGGIAALLMCLQIVLEIRLWAIAFGGGQDKEKDKKEDGEDER